jgi:hypothetical protein
MSVNLHLYESTYRSEGIGAPIKFADIDRWHMNPSLIAGAIPRTQMPFVDQSFVRDHKVYRREFQYALFIPKNRNSEQTTLGDGVVPKSRIGSHCGT